MREIFNNNEYSDKVIDREISMFSLKSKKKTQTTDSLESNEVEEK